MKSPFPGMDPWLEKPSVFPDLHDRLVGHVSESLNERLPDGYVASINRLVWVDPERWRKPDISTFAPVEHQEFDSPASGTSWQAEWGGTMVAVADEEPESGAEPWTQQYVEILDTNDRRVVTAIEFLSPTNKSNGDAGQVAFVTKQKHFLETGVNLVEFDFLRGGTHVTAIPRHVLRARCGAYDYHVCVSVPAEKRKLLAAFRLPDTLPTIGVPLDPGVAPVSVELQPLFGRSYRAGRYDKLIDYRKPCDPPLSADQAAWAASLLMK